MLLRVFPRLAMVELRGVVERWSPFERRGTIRVATGEHFEIPGTSCFETLMPTMLRRIDGSAVRFTGDTETKIAKNIIVEASNVAVVTQGGELPPPVGIRDMRADAMKATKQHGTAQGDEVPLRRAPATQGKVAAWNSVLRRGIVEVVSASQETESYVIFGAGAFETALPSSIPLRGATVEFHAVTKEGSTQKFAEHIKVLHIEEAAKAKDVEKKEGTTLVATLTEEETPVPHGPILGVMIRWSGGEGAIEAVNGHTYFVDGALNFKMLDPAAVALRGAIVSFTVDSSAPKFARDVKIVSDMSDAIRRGDRGFAKADPLPLTVPPPRDENPPQDSSCSTDDGSNKEIVWLRGKLVTWSAAERQGVVAEVDTKERYLLRDAEKDFEGYVELAHIIKRGDFVQFTVGGATGRLAQRVSLLPAAEGATLLDDKPESPAVSEQQQSVAEPGLPTAASIMAARLQSAARPQPEEAEQEQQPQQSADPSPLASNYWVARFEKVGHNMDEYKKLRENPVPPTEDEVMQGFEEDEWLKKKGENVTHGTVKWADLANVSQAGLMRMSIQMQNDKKREEIKKKAEARLSPEMRDYAMKKAKDAAPRYLKALQDARRKGTEPQFSFI